MMKEKQWYIVHTHAGSELKILYTLEKKHIECFCPLSTTSTGAKKKVTPLFSKYIFVRASAEDQATIRRIDGVVNFMYWLGEYTIVKDEDIAVLKELTVNYQVLTVEKIQVNTAAPTGKTWETLMVKNESGIEEQEDFVKVSFPAYGFAVAAKESKMNVKVININTNRSKQKIAGL